MLHFETIFQNSPLPPYPDNSFNSNELVRFLRSGTLFAYTSASNETQRDRVFRLLIFAQSFGKEVPSPIVAIPGASRGRLRPAWA